MNNMPEDFYSHVLYDGLSKPRGDVRKIKAKSRFNQQKTDLNDGDIDQPVVIFAGNVFFNGMLN